MSRSAAEHVQVEIRMAGTDGDRIRTILSRIATVSAEDDQAMIVESAPSTDPDAPLVVIGPDSEEEMLAAVEEGALGYVVASSSAEDIEAALTTVAGGAAVIPPMMLGALLRHTVWRRQRVAQVEEQLSVLTEREREVIEQLSLGRGRQVIAKRLGISPDTVRTHIQRAMGKLEVHSQNELMALLAPLEQGHT